MRELKFLGIIHKPNTSRAYQYAIFECPECKKHIEKIRKDGRRADYCSHKCYAKNRKRRGSYRPSVIISQYRYILTPDHPYCTKKGYVAEHRLVAEKIEERYLSSEEVVHHIDNDRLNNSPQNLRVMTISEHSSMNAFKKEREINGKFKTYKVSGME
jgi:DNA-directed RNA polymerase subunit RPC12/RpoP